MKINLYCIYGQILISEFWGLYWFVSIPKQGMFMYIYKTQEGWTRPLSCSRLIEADNDDDDRNEN